VETKIVWCPIWKYPGCGWPKQIKFVVDDLPFPNSRYNAMWQREFHPTLLSWASTVADLYTTNTELDESIIMEIWYMVYPDLDLNEDEHEETAPKLAYLVCDMVHSQNNCYSTFTGW